MSHMVIYRGNDGKPGYHQTDDIHDAVGFVEQMRNEEGVEHARIFRLEEVVFEYRPYYRVELTDSMAPVNGSSTNGGAEVGSGSTGSESTNGDPSSKDEKKDADKAESSASTDTADSGEGDSGEGDSESGDDDDLKTVAGAKKGLFGR